MTVCDGLIWLRQSVERNSMVRKMEIRKMRGQATIPGLHTFRISNAGVEVFAPVARATSPEHPEALPDGARLSIGIAGVDEMLGGGLPRGFSILIAGPSGSGKSILAAQFLAEGARCGEKGVFAAFEQRPSKLRNLWWPRSSPRQCRPGRQREADLSIDETLRLLDQGDRPLKPRASSSIHCRASNLRWAPTFREDFRESSFA